MKTVIRATDTRLARAKHENENENETPSVQSHFSFQIGKQTTVGKLTDGNNAK